MGIPSFYRWLVENYPKVLCNGDEKQNNTNYKSLYIDMNGVIHSAVKLDNSGNIRGTLIKTKDISNETIRSSLYYRLDQIIHSIKPNHILYIATDGVPPRAKSIEQRKRRFKASKEALENISKQQNKYTSNRNGTVQISNPNPEVSNSNNNTTPIEYFDSNSISPATEFIMEINEWVKEYLLKISKEYENLNIIYSDSTIQGEGEHKIMDFIRSYQGSKFYQSDETHIFYGMDADLIFLGLSTHEKNFFVLRDALDLIQCSTCKSNDGHLSYECPSAYARRKLTYEISNKITIKNIPISADEKSIRDLFIFYGQVISISLEKANTKRPSLTGIVEFKDTKTVREITGRGGSWFINDDRITIHTITPTGSLDNNTDENIDDNNNNNNNNNSQNTEEMINDLDEEVINNTIFISNIDITVSKFDIEAYFSQYGIIEKVEILPSPRYPKQKFACVAYRDQESARVAYKLSRNTHFFGNQVTVKKPLPRRVPETPEQKEERDKKSLIEKEARKLEREFKCMTFQSMTDKDTTKETCYFYLGVCDWDLDKSYKLYLEFDKAPLELPNRTINYEFDYVNLNVFRQYFKHYMTVGLEDSQKELIDESRCINDFTLMSMLLGNDFLPHLPALHINSGSIELILSWYREFITGSIKSSNQVKYLTTKDSNNIIFENFLSLLIVLTKWESHIYPEKLEKQVKKEFRFQNGYSHHNYQNINNNNNNNNETQLNTSPDKIVHTLKDLNINNGTKKSNEQIDSEFEFNYKDDSYYQIKLKLQYLNEKDQLIKNMCKSFIEGLVWVLRYYTHGCKSWEWFYPFHYAPLAKDLVDYVKNEISQGNQVSDFKFQLGEVLQPLVHLTSVLPIYSSKFLPSPLRDLMVSPSPLSMYYKEDFKIDLNGEDVPWKGVVLLDFIDFNLFKELANPLLLKLTPEELKRNKIGQNQLIVNNQIYDLSDLSSDSTGETNSSGLVQSNSFSIQKSNNRLLNERDLNWATRKIFTLSPTPLDQFYNSLPKTVAKIAPSHQDAIVVLSEQQSLFINWRKLNGFNQSLEILESIDSKLCNALNIGKNNSLSMTSSILRLFSNEISKFNDIFVSSQDDDPQLIINIGFNKPTKVNGIKFLSSFKEFSPKSIKIYINNSIDFNSTSNEKYKIEFNSHDQLSLNDPSIFNFTDLKFKPIQSLSIFIESNFAGKGNTKLEKIILL